MPISLKSWLLLVIFAFLLIITLAERDLRMINAAMLTFKQKVNGVFRSAEGAQMFTRIQGYISTVKKQGRNVLEELTNALQGYPFQPLWYFTT